MTVVVNGHVVAAANRCVILVDPSGRQDVMTARQAAKRQARYRGEGYGPVAMFPVADGPVVRISRETAASLPR